MTVAILTPPADDFDAWESEFDPQPVYRPSKAARRREDQEVIDRQQGFRRHRTAEREA